jgi:hypothetical protein
MTVKTKILKLTTAGAVLSLLAGCIVLSVYPFYTPKDLIFDAALTGHWADASKANSFWQIGDLNGKSYLLTTADDHDTNSFEAHLFQLRQYQFLDLLATNRGEFQMPVHLISKVVHEDTNLSLQFMDFGWLAELLRTNPAVLRHIVLPDLGNTNDSLDDGNDKMVYLTADTKDLQKFLLKHAEDTNAFNSGSAVDLKRLSP